VTATESKDLKKGARVYWRGDAADSGTITEKSWDAVKQLTPLIYVSDYDVSCRKMHACDRK
jgi:hypothetical protein